MNRYATFAILALAALALAANSAPTPEEETAAATQAMLSNTDAEETAEVRARGMEAFADFCVQSRNYVYTDVKQKADKVASEGFSFFFQTADEMAREVLSVQQDAAGRLANQMANPDAEVDGDDDIAAAQRQIAGQTQPQGFFTGIRAALSAGSNAVVNAVSEKIQSMKKFTTPQQFIYFAANGCDMINSYEAELRRQFEEYKQEHGQDESITMERVPCMTSTRIVKADGVCTFVKVSFEPLRKVWGAGNQN